MAAGEPSEVYPFPWTVCSWVSGMPLPPGGLGFGDVAVLADLVLALRSLDTAGGRSSRASRRPVAAYDSVAPCSLPSEKRGPARVHQPASRTSASVMLS